MSIDNDIELNTNTLIELLKYLQDISAINISCKNGSSLKEFRESFSFIEDLIDKESKKNELILRSNSAILKKKLVLLEEIKRKTDTFINTINTLIIKRNYDLSIIDLYNITSKNIDINNSNYNIYLEFKKGTDFIYDDYDWINKFINEELIRSKIIQYIKYKKFQNISKFKRFKENIDEIEFKNVVAKLNCLLNNKYTLSPPIYINEFTDDFLNLRIPLDISDEELLKLVTKINIIHNYELLTNFKKQKWYDVFYYKNYTNTKIRNKKIIDIYNKTEKRIFNEYKENLELVNIFLKSFSFVNSILNENITEDLKEYIYDEGDLYIYLKDLRNNLLLYREFTKIKKNVSSLSPKEVSLFDFCYKNTTTVEGFLNILTSIPNMLLYRYIEEIEAKNEITISKYNQLEKIVIYLSNCINTLKSKRKYNKKGISEKIVNEDECSSDGRHKYNIKLINYDLYLNLINRYSDLENLIKELGEGRSLVDKAKPPMNLKFLKEAIESFGYKTFENFNYHGINLELIVYKENPISSFIYIHLDSLIIRADITLTKLLFLKEKNIPVFYYWSKLFWISNNTELIKLKEFLSYNLSK